MAQGSDGEPDRPPPPDDGDLSKRLERLGEKLERRSNSKPTEGGGSRMSRADASGLSRALQLSSEFVGGVIAGALIGWVFDHFLGSKPWGLILFTLLGFVAGVMNVMRSAGLSARPGDK